VSKGVYIDGHRREDVVQYRNHFEMQPHVHEWEETHDEKGVSGGAPL
jgi:hypothetical protein